MKSLTITQILFLYIAAVSLLSIAVTVADKLLAITHSHRVPEATLLLLAALGGSVTMLLTMLLIRHKIRKIKFMAGIPFIILLQAALIFGIWRFNTIHIVM